MTYEIDLSRAFNDRVISMKKNNQQIKLDEYYTIVLNNYRASNTSIYPCYENAEVIKEINIDMNEIIIDYFQKHNEVKVVDEVNYVIKY